VTICNDNDCDDRARTFGASGVPSSLTSPVSTFFISKPPGRTALSWSSVRISCGSCCSVSASWARRTRAASAAARWRPSRSLNPTIVATAPKIAPPRAEPPLPPLASAGSADCGTTCLATRRKRASPCVSIVAWLGDRRGAGRRADLSHRRPRRARLGSRAAAALPKF
jgi:hypothetical protein